MSEAKLKRTEHGSVPEGEGWYVLNLSDCRWRKSEHCGTSAQLEGEKRFDEIGVHVTVLAPGQPACMYHRESAQEDFLVLSGECRVLIDGEDRPLRAWDFVNCPPGTDHVFVGAGKGPCAILMLGARPKDLSITYPVSDLARAHGASAEQETNQPREAYEGKRDFEQVPSPWPGIIG